MPYPEPAPSQNRCECVTCGACHGLGRLHDPFDYSGSDYEPCFDCDGSGITEECDYCRDLLDDDSYLI